MLLNEKILQTQLGRRVEGRRVNLALRFLKIKKQVRHFTLKGELNVSHVSCYAVGNAGDTVLSECVRRTFDKEFSDRIGWRLHSVYEPVDQNLIRDVNASQMLVIGGGGLFLPDTNKNSISGWQWACSQEMLDRIEVPVLLYSVGYNYFRGQEPDSLFINNLNALIEKSSFVGLRNHGSIEAIRPLLQKSLQDKVCYQPCTTTLIRRILPDLPPKVESGKIAFNFAFDRAEMRYGDYQEDILCEIMRGIYRIREKGYEIYIVAHCTGDLSVLPMISDWKKIHVVNAAAWDLDRLARFYNGMDVVLGMRGHAQMIPFGVNCHIISLGSHEKMRWFLEDIDAEEWYVELTHDIPSLSDRIVGKFEEIHEHRKKETTQHIMQAQDRLLKITKDNMGKIKDFMGFPTSF